MDNKPQSNTQDIFKMSIAVSCTVRSCDGSISEPLQTQFVLEAEQIASLFGLLLQMEPGFPDTPKNGIVKVKDDRLKEALPVLHDSVVHHLTEELKSKALGDEVSRFELLVDKDELQEKGIAIAYTIEMYKIGRRAELHRRDREQPQSEHCIQKESTELSFRIVCHGQNSNLV